MTLRIDPTPLSLQARREKARRRSERRDVALYCLLGLVLALLAWLVAG
jgi:hypothetical protein